jgi:hypothetical protein
MNLSILLSKYVLSLSPLPVLVAIALAQVFTMIAQIADTIF